MSTWTIDIESKFLKNIDRYTTLLNQFIYFSENMNVNFFINLESSTFSFIEKFIYDNVKFHMKRLNVHNEKNMHVSCWTKHTEYNFDHIHMHVDHCDYESRVHKTEFKKPLFTSIIYLDDNSCPTLITDITRDMVETGNFHTNNNKLCFSFPKVLKNIVFDSGKYYHGESYLSDYKSSDRKTIVIAVWDDANKPSYIPFFDNHLFYYHLFTKYGRTIVENEYDEFDPNETLCKIENRNESTTTIEVNDVSLLNGEFFYKLIVEREKNIMFKFAKIINTIKNPDTVILDFSNLLLSKPLFPNMNCHIENFQMTLKSDTKYEIFLFNELMKIKEEVIFDPKLEKINIIERYIHDIASHHLTSFDDFQITFSTVHDNDTGKIHKPSECAVQTCIVCLEDSENPLLLSDIDYDSYKYKDIENKKICLITSRKNVQIVFSGGYYHNYNSNKLLIIKFWRKNVPLSFKHYINPSSGLNTFNCNEVSIIKKDTKHAIPLSLEEDVFHECIYKSTTQLSDIGYTFENDTFLVSLSKPKDIIQDDEQTTKPKQFQRIKFSELEL